MATAVGKHLTTHAGYVVQIAYLLPKRRVDNVSETCKELGEQQQSRVVLELPPC